MKLLNSKLSRKIDGDVIEKYIPGILLMERAAANIYYKCAEHYGKLKGKRIALFCGGGNNGGDGFAAARYFMKECCVTLFFLGNEEKLPDDAKKNYDICKKLGIEFTEKIEGEFDIIIDAMIGTGLNKILDAKYLEAVNFINNSNGFIVSADIPTGISADTGAVMGDAVRADITVTFHSAKIGHLLYPGREYTGILEVTDIGIPVESSIDSKYSGITQSDIKLKMRDKRLHKGGAGKVLVIGGSRGMTGAPYMASEGALRAGAGLVTIALPESLNIVMEIKTTEAMTLPLPETERGNIAVRAVKSIIEFIEMGKIDVIVLGSGIGREEESMEFVKEIIRESSIPIVLDADGLYAVKDDISIIREKKIVITPHEVEFMRLRKGKTIENRLYDCEGFVEESGVVTVLKGADTIVGERGRYMINTTGNPGMAVGGSGDVLAGIIGGLIAQGYDLYDAAKAGVYIHGRAGDISAEEKSYESMLPRDILDKIGEAVKGLMEIKENIE